MAVLAMIATTFVLATAPSPVGAAAVEQTVNCGLGGNQVLRVNGDAPATVPRDGIFTVDLGFESGVADGSSISNMRWAFQAPAGSTIVPGSGSVIGTGSTTGGSFGTVTTVISGSVIELRTTGTISNGATFTPPSLRVQLQATGVGGTVLNVRSRSSNAYTLSASGLNISCNTTGALANYTSTQIESAGPPTTPPDGTTDPQPVVTTEDWTPGGGCGAVQSTTAPAKARSMTVNVAGAPGGRSGGQGGGATVAGGPGGQAVASFPVSPGDTVAAVVGCAGTDGGNFANTTASAGYSPGGTTGRGSVIAGVTGASGGTGGGSSAVCIGTVCEQDSPGVVPLVVAGAGGGGGVSNCAGTPSGPGGTGGAGSSTDLGAGGGASGLAGGGGGNSGGSSGGGSGGAGGVNADGGIGTGGTSPNGSGGAGLNVVGGGGGGGYIGGAQGGNANTGCKGAGGGGGGSTWISTGATDPSVGTASGGAAITVTFTIVDDAPPPPPARTPRESFVTAALTDFLGEADPDAVTAGVADLEGGMRKATFLNQLTTSDAWLGAVVDRLYLDTLGRPADTTGRAHWIDELRSGRRTVAQAASLFYSSPEYFRRAGNTNPTWIDDLYVKILGRPADTAGRQTWVTHTQNNGRAWVAIRFYQSDESARTRVRALYETLLGRTAEPGGLAHWMPRVKTEGDLALALNLAASTEYANRAVTRFP